MVNSFKTFSKNSACSITYVSCNVVFVVLVSSLLLNILLSYSSFPLFFLMNLRLLTVYILKFLLDATF